MVLFTVYSHLFLEFQIFRSWGPPPKIWITSPMAHPGIPLSSDSTLDGSSLDHSLSSSSLPSSLKVDLVPIAEVVNVLLLSPRGHNHVI